LLDGLATPQQRRLDEMQIITNVVPLGDHLSLIYLNEKVVKKWPDRTWSLGLFATTT